MVQEAAAAGNVESVGVFLATLKDTLKAMQAIFARMGEKCRPDIYYHRKHPPHSCTNHG